MEIDNNIKKLYRLISFVILIESFIALLFMIGLNLENKMNDKKSELENFYKLFFEFHQLEYKNSNLDHQSHLHFDEHEIILREQSKILEEFKKYTKEEKIIKNINDVKDGTFLLNKMEIALYSNDTDYNFLSYNKLKNKRGVELNEIAQSIRKNYVSDISKLESLISKFNFYRFTISIILFLIALYFFRKILNLNKIQFSLLNQIEKHNKVLDLTVEERTRELHIEIEEHKKTENELKEKDYFITTLINNLKSAIFMKDLNGKIILVNKILPNSLGLSEEDILGKDDYSYYPKELVENAKKYDKQIIESKKALSYEQVSKGIDGKTVYMQVDKVPLINDKGEVYSICGSITDITLIREQERLLFNEKEKINRILEEAPIGIFIAINDVIKFANPALSQIVDMQLDGFCSNACPNEIMKKRMMSELEYTDLVKNIEIEMYGPNREIKNILATFLKVNYDNETGILGWLVDISSIKKSQLEMKKAKELAEQASRIKSEFLANMSHEIRTPMNAIIGLNELLKKTQLTKKQFDYVQKVEHSAENLLRIINDILDFSKIEANKLSFETNDFNFDEMLYNIASVVNLKAQEKSLEFIIAKDISIPTLLWGDSLRLSQVLINLITNSIKFTEKGQVVLTIKNTETNKEKISLYFEVSDTGIGISDEQKNRIFEAFDQGDTSTTRKYGGTGLGLVISQRIINMFGGNIEVSSELGIGSKFYFTLNLNISGKKIKDKSIDKLKNIKTLVFNESPIISNLLQEYLNQWGMNVILTNNSSNVLDLINEDIDLFIFDYKEKNIEIWNNIKVKLDSNLTKSIMINSYESEEITNKAKKLGIDAIILKPILASTLYNCILEALEIEGDNTNRLFEENYNLDLIKGAKILVVEDNEINQQVIRETLEHEGFFVDIAKNGIEAVEKAKEIYYDLVLMDLQMPILDGYNASKEIRLFKDYNELPIIALSADAMKGTKDRVVEAQMNDYLTKPIERKSFFKTIKKWIKEGDRKVFAQENNNLHSKSLSIESLEKQLRNFDVQKTLDNISNNLDLYIELLKKFERNNENFIDNLTRLVNTENFADARIAIHSLKGVAGNLGNKEIYNLASLLEEKITNGINILELEEFEKLGLSLSDSINQVKSIKEREKESILEIFTDEILKAKLKILLESLDNYDIKSEELFFQLKETLINKFTKEKIQTVENLIKKYSYNEARILLEDLGGLL